MICVKVQPWISLNIWLKAKWVSCWRLNQILLNYLANLRSKVSSWFLERALELANIVVVLVDHKEFKAADKTEFAKKVVIDTRGVVA